MKTPRKTSTEIYSELAGQRIRVVWNPKSNLWYGYKLENDDAIFATARLELHTVGVYGELRPHYAPNGSPSFIGTIPTDSVLNKKASKPIYVHPYAPAKLFLSMAEDNAVEFSHAKRVLLDGLKMFCKTP